MESSSIIVQALAAGAVAEFRPGIMIKKTDEIIDQAYVRLKARLKEKYPQVDADMLDFGPGSEERQRLLEAQLTQTGALDDEELNASAKDLLETILTYEPQAAMAVGLIMPGSPFDR
jgi:hypothetical protein